MTYYYIEIRKIERKKKRGLTIRALYGKIIEYAWLMFGTDRKKNYIV
jgi:hypothetical protein